MWGWLLRQIKDAKDSTTPINTPSSTPSSSTPAVVAINVAASLRSWRHDSDSVDTSIMPTTATTMVAAMAGKGISDNQALGTHSATAIKPAENKVANGVLAPAA